MKTMLLWTLLFLVTTATLCGQNSRYEYEYQYPIGEGALFSGLLGVSPDRLRDGVVYQLGEEYFFVDDQGNNLSAVGKPVYAFGNGYVTQVVQSLDGNWEVHMRHDLPGNKKITSVYRYLEFVAYTVGDFVWRGNIIGRIGEVPDNFGNGLYFQLRRGAKSKTGENFYGLYAGFKSGGKKYGTLVNKLSPTVFIDDVGHEKVYDLLAINSRVAPIINFITVDAPSRLSTVYVEYYGAKFNLTQARAKSLVYGNLMRYDTETGAQYRLRPNDLLYPHQTYALYVYRADVTLHIPVTQSLSISFPERAMTDIIHHLRKKGGFYHIDPAYEEVFDGEDSIGFRFRYYKTARDYHANKPRVIEHEQYKYGPLRVILLDGDADKAISVKQNFTQ